MEIGEVFNRHKSAAETVRALTFPISLPKDQIVWVHREVRAGRAGSVSGYIAKVLAEQERRESLRELLRDLMEQHGEPAAKDIKWAEHALKQRRG